MNFEMIVELIKACVAQGVIPDDEKLIYLDKLIHSKEEQILLLKKLEESIQNTCIYAKGIVH